MARSVDTIVIHCTQTSPEQRVRLWDLTKSALNAGYLSPGNLLPFHFLIRRNASVVEGRPLELTGAHPDIAGLNATVVNVVLVGGAHSIDRQGQNNFTTRQFRKLRGVIADLRGRLDRPVVILGGDALIDRDSPAFDWWGFLEKEGLNGQG